MNVGSLLTAVTPVGAGAVLVACQPTDRAQHEAVPADAGADVVEITAEDFEFGAPESIPLGWTTVRSENASDEQEHFLLYRVPANRTFADYRSRLGSSDPS